MTHTGPSDPDPRESPDVDSGGSPTGPQTPDSDSTSMESDSGPRKLSPTERQSPTKTNSSKGPLVWIVVIAVVVLLVVVGLVGYMFEIL